MIDFDQINRVALSALPILLHRWMPDGRQRGREFIARNPSREDRRPGSFTINTATGRWADYTPKYRRRPKWPAFPPVAYYAAAGANSPRVQLAQKASVRCLLEGAHRKRRDRRITAPGAVGDSRHQRANLNWNGSAIRQALSAPEWRYLHRSKGASLRPIFQKKQLVIWEAAPPFRDLPTVSRPSSPGRAAAGS